MEKIRFFWEIIKKNQQYGYVFLVFWLVFLINRSFPAEIITSEFCIEKNCKAGIEKPSLSDKKASFFANDIFESKNAGYYRLIFKAKSNQDSKIKVSITNALDENKEIKNLEIKESQGSVFWEIVFSTQDGKNYTDVLFEKENPNDGSEINIAGVQVSKLNISGEEEFAKLKPTIKEEAKRDIVDQSQIINSGSFDQLVEPGIILGEVFQTEVDYISGVSLDFDVINQGNGGGKKYKLELRNVNYEENGVPEIKSDILSGVNFTIDDLAKYRQKDGRYKFPLFAKTEKGKYYFIGINNDKVEVNKFNYIRLKGNPDGEKYKNGLLAVKNKGQAYSQAGDLCFETYGMEFNNYSGKKVLLGETIEDLGKQKGVFKYQPRENIYDLADLYSFSSDMSFEEERTALAGLANSGKDSNFIYKFETFFPAVKFNIFAKQPDIRWNKINISYSFDEKKWTEIPPISADGAISQDEGIQIFDYSFSEAISKNTIYVKIAPKEPLLEGKEYGISNFRFEADLIMR